MLLINETTGETYPGKVPSTPADSSIGVLNGIASLCERHAIDPKRITHVMHGTTVATNTVLEGKGARVGLVTTKGYRQVLQMARSFVPGGLGGWVIYNKRPLLAPLELTIEADERMDARGTVIRPLDESALRASLAGLINRRAFMDRFSHELLRSQRHGPAPTLLILDIDHFKKINDKHGHPAGDAVLAHLAHLLKSSLRNVDIVARIGGEEFAVVLVETNAEMGQPVIERLLDRIRETTVVLADGTPLHFTASIGSTEILWGDTIDAAIQRADEALYTAKNGGRNRHCQR